MKPPSQSAFPLHTSGLNWPARLRPATHCLIHFFRLHAGLFGLTPTLAAASVLPPSAQRAQRELMREALDLELLEVRQDHGEPCCKG